MNEFSPPDIDVDDALFNYVAKRGREEGHGFVYEWKRGERKELYENTPDTMELITRNAIRIRVANSMIKLARQDWNRMLRHGRIKRVRCTRLDFAVEN